MVSFSCTIQCYVLPVNNDEAMVALEAPEARFDACPVEDSIFQDCGRSYREKGRICHHCSKVSLRRCVGVCSGSTRSPGMVTGLIEFCTTNLMTPSQLGAIMSLDGKLRQRAVSQLSCLPALFSFDPTSAQVAAGSLIEDLSRLSATTLLPMEHTTQSHFASASPNTQHPSAAATPITQISSTTDVSSSEVQTELTPEPVPQSDASAPCVHKAVAPYSRRTSSQHRSPSTRAAYTPLPVMQFCPRKATASRTGPGR